MPMPMLVLVLLLLAALVPVVAWAKYDDVLVLKNGDRISGDVKELNREQLRYKTDAMGTVYVRWDDVASLQTDKFLRIELKSGRRVVGSISPDESVSGRLLIVSARENESHAFSSVIAFVPLKLRSNWVDRIDGDVKFGLNGTKGSNTLQWNLGANAIYRGQDWDVSSRFDSIITDKSDDTSSERINFVNTYRKLRSNRWFWSALVSYERNDELGIDHRYSGGGGLGRFVMRSNAFELVLNGGVLASREFRTDVPNSQLEGYLGFSMAWFRHRFPKTDVRADAFVLPSLTDNGRVRTNWDLSIAREIIQDLKLDLSIYYSTDNQSPEEAGRNDWGVLTSIAYTF